MNSKLKKNAGDKYRFMAGRQNSIQYDHELQHKWTTPSQSDDPAPTVKIYVMTWK